MNAKFWFDRWLEGRIGFHLPVVNPWLEKYLDDFNLAKGARVFVPLCGKSLDLKFLSDKALEVVGVELVAQAVNDFFIEHGFEPKMEQVAEFTKYTVKNLSVYQGNFFALDKNLLGEVDLVFDRAALIAFPPKIRKQYARYLQKIIGDCQQILLITMEYPEDKIKAPPFTVKSKEVEELFSANFAIKLLGEKDLTSKAKFSQCEYAKEQAWKLSYRA